MEVESVKEQTSSIIETLKIIAEAEFQGFIWKERKGGDLPVPWLELHKTTNFVCCAMHDWLSLIFYALKATHFGTCELN